jgi:hypothetical protein
MVRCSDGKDRSHGQTFSTFADALHFAEWEHVCTSSRDHAIYERLAHEYTWHPANIPSTKQPTKEQMT